MELTLSVFLSQAGDHPVLLGILALVIGVTIISGATDAPNAIASAVSTRCLTPGAALALAATPCSTWSISPATPTRRYSRS